MKHEPSVGMRILMRVYAPPSRAEHGSSLRAIVLGYDLAAKGAAK